MSHVILNVSPSHVNLLPLFSATYAPSGARAGIWPWPASSRGLPHDPAGPVKSKMPSSFLPDLSARAGRTKQCFLLLKLSVASFGESQRKPSIHPKMVPQTSITSLGWSMNFTSSHPKFLVPSEGVRRCRNVSPPVENNRAIFPPSEPAAWAHTILKMILLHCSL
jgi:hypothetical protein